MRYIVLPGLALPLFIALAATGLANTAWMQHYQLSSLTLAILLGMAAGNLGQLRGVGLRPLLLALLLFGWLVIGGVGLTQAINALVG